MNRFRILSIRRNQLAEFLPDQKSIKEFERLFTQDNELAESVSNIIIAVGLDDEGNYIVPTDSNFIDGTDSLYSAMLVFDETISTNLIININTDIELDEESQLIIADATSNDIDIKLPNPANMIHNNRSKRVTTTRKDTSRFDVTILPYSGEDIAFESYQDLIRQGETLVFVTDGINWYIGG